MGIKIIYRITLFLLFYSMLSAQFGETTITVDTRLLKANDRQQIQTLEDEIGRFFINMPWEGDYSDLSIPIHIQLIIQGTASKGAETIFLSQILFSNGGDQRYFDKSFQFTYNSAGGINYNPGFFEPLAGFLAYAGSLILAGEADTYEPNGGTFFYEIGRDIAMRGNISEYSKGWAERLRLINELGVNFGLRKARFAFYYGQELFQKGNLDEALVQLNDLIASLEIVYEAYGREHQTGIFMKANAKEIGRILGMLGQKKLLWDLVELDPDNEQLYQEIIESF